MNDLYIYIGGICISNMYFNIFYDADIMILASLTVIGLHHMIK